MQDAYNKANDTASELAWNSAVRPFKDALKGTVSGAVVGCIASSEVGCFEGALPGALTGAMAGTLEGSAAALYDDFTGFFAVRQQLEQDLAACNNK